MFSKEMLKAKLYNLKSVIDGMIAATDGNVLTPDQAIGVINMSVGKLNEENEKTKDRGC